MQTEIKCKNCGKIFSDYPSNKRLYCSKRCGYASLKGKRSMFKGMKNRYSKETLLKMREAKLGKPSWNKGKKFPEFSRENHPNWKGGIINATGGYINQKVGNGDYKYQHRIIMENHIKRHLTKNECVHHLDGDRKNNNIKNLILLSNSDHRKLHHYQKLFLTKS